MFGQERDDKYTTLIVSWRRHFEDLDFLHVSERRKNGY